MLLVDHDMALIMRICNRIYVLDYGQIIAEGPPEQIRDDPQVVRAYLGDGRDRRRLDGADEKRSRRARRRRSGR